MLVPLRGLGRKGIKDLESYGRMVGIFSLIGLVFISQVSVHHFLNLFVLVVFLKNSYFGLLICGEGMYTHLSG